MTRREKRSIGPLAVVALTVMAATAAGCTARQIAKVEEMLGRLQKGDYAGAYTCCTEEKFRSKVSPERFETVLADIPFQKATKIEVEFGRYFADESATANATLATPDGPVHLTFYIYMKPFGSDFLVGQILAGDLRLFAEELGDW